MSAGPATETQINQLHQDKDFQAVALDVYNGSSTQVQAFKNQTGITYPFGMQAGSLQSAYGLSRDYSVVVDQQGIIRYKASGVNVAAINTIINQLLVTTGVDEELLVATRYALHQNYPNPFNPATQIVFELPEAAQVRLRVFSSDARQVDELLNESLPAGKHVIEWRARDRRGQELASGIYVYSLQAGNFKATRKMILMR